MIISFIMPQILNLPNNLLTAAFAHQFRILSFCSYSYIKEFVCSFNGLLCLFFLSILSGIPSGKALHPISLSNQCLQLKHIKFIVSVIYTNICCNKSFLKVWGWVICFATLSILLSNLRNRFATLICSSIAGIRIFIPK